MGSAETTSENAPIVIFPLRFPVQSWLLTMKRRHYLALSLIFHKSINRLYWRVDYDRDKHPPIESRQ
jgi:hypothetical protein